MKQTLKKSSRSLRFLNNAEFGNFTNVIVFEITEKEFAKINNAHPQPFFCSFNLFLATLSLPLASWFSKTQ